MGEGKRRGLGEKEREEERGGEKGRKEEREKEEGKEEERGREKEEEEGRERESKVGRREKGIQDGLRRPRNSKIAPSCKHNMRSPLPFLTRPAA